MTAAAELVAAAVRRAEGELRQARGAAEELAAELGPEEREMVAVMGSVVKLLLPLSAERSSSRLEASRRVRRRRPGPAVASRFVNPLRETEDGDGPEPDEEEQS